VVLVFLAIMDRDNATPHPLRHQLLAMCVAPLAGSGELVRLSPDGDWAGMSAWMIGTLFIPSLALAWSGSSKLFEGVYVIMCPPALWKG
jgi:hypothetical protein